MNSLFDNRDYRLLFTAQVVALFGTGLATVALGLLAHDLAGPRAGAVLGTALTVKMVAYVVIAPIAGAIADRLPRRWLMIGLDLVRALIVAVLPWVTEIWQIYVLIALLQSASAVFTPTFQAVIPDILPDERTYTRALAAAQTASSMETLLSPLLAAVALAVIDFHWLFTGTILGFALSAACVAASRIPRARPVAQAAFVERILRGTKVFLATPRLRGVLALDMAVAGAGSIIMVNTVNYVHDVLGRSASDMAVLLAAHGLGTIIVAVTLPRVLDRFPERDVMITGAIVLCLGTGGFVALSLTGPAGWYAALVVWGVTGAGTGMVLTPIGGLLRRSSTESDRPAVFAAQFSLSHGCWLMTYPIAGWVVTAIGFTGGWLTLAAITILATITAGVLWPRHDPKALTHVHHGLDADHTHLTDARATGDEEWSHSHVFTIDDLHRHWPARSRTRALRG